MRALRRVALSVVGALGLIVVGSAALFVTSSPKWLSMMVEPLSLLLTPGVALSMLLTKAHDYTQWEILKGAFGFYVAALWVLLRWWDGRRGLSRR